MLILTFRVMCYKNLGFNFFYWKPPKYRTIGWIEKPYFDTIVLFFKVPNCCLTIIFQEDSRKFGTSSSSFFSVEVAKGKKVMRRHCANQRRSHCLMRSLKPGFCWIKWNIIITKSAGFKTNVLLLALEPLWKKSKYLTFSDWNHRSWNFASKIRLI